MCKFYRIGVVTKTSLNIVEVRFPRVKIIENSIEFTCLRVSRVTFQREVVLVERYIKKGVTLLRPFTTFFCVFRCLDSRGWGYPNN